MEEIKIKEVLNSPSQLPLSTVMSSLLAIIYVSGFLIHSFYTKGIGVPSLPVLNAEYIETGMIFLIFTIFIIAPPFLILRSIDKTNKLSGTPNTLEMYITSIVASVLIFFIMFFALFTTYSDLIYDFTIFGKQFPPLVLYISYFLSVIICLLLIVYIRQYNFQHKENHKKKLLYYIDNAMTSQLVRSIVNTLRALEVMITLLFIILLCLELPWFIPLLAHMWLYLCFILVIVISAKYVNWLSIFFKLKGKNNLFLLIGLPFFLGFYLVLIATYSYGVYTNIPVNRGGRYPVTSAILVVNEKSDFPSGYIEKKEDHYIVSKPVFILEDGEDYLYFTQIKNSNDWFNDTPIVEAIRKTNLVRIELHSITDGRPRM